MMQSYIDEKYMVHFFESLAKTTNSFTDEEDNRREILKFFKSKTNVLIDSDFSSVLNQIDPNNKQVISTLINYLTTGRNGTNVYSKQHNKFRDLKNVNIYSKIKKPFVSFWLGNKYKHPIDKYRDANPFYFLTDKDDIEKWSDFSYTKTFHIGSKSNKNLDDVLTSWDQLSSFAHPFKDIIINDGYCLKDNTGIKENMIPIVKNLSSLKGLVENIIFFVKRGELYKNSIKETYDTVRDLLDENKISSNLIIYQSNKTPHDRFIITNNFFLKSGDSFDYFNPNNGYKTRGTTLSVSPIFNVNKSELNNLFQILINISSTASEDMVCGKKQKSILDLL